MWARTGEGTVVEVPAAPRGAVRVALLRHVVLRKVVEQAALFGGEGDGSAVSGLAAGARWQRTSALLEVAIMLDK